MKKLIISFLLIGLIFTTTSCVHSSSNDSNEFFQNEPWVLVDCIKHDSMIIQKILYNSETKLTYVYNYYWEYSSIYICKEFTVTVFDETGQVIEN